MLKTRLSNTNGINCWNWFRPLQSVSRISKPKIFRKKNVFYNIPRPPPNLLHMEQIWFFPIMFILDLSSAYVFSAINAICLTSCWCTCYLHVTMIFNGVFKFAPYGANLIYMNTAATTLTVSIFTNIKIQNWRINHLRDLSCPYIYVILVRITMEKFLYTK